MGKRKIRTHTSVNGVPVNEDDVQDYLTANNLKMVCGHCKPRPNSKTVRIHEITAVPESFTTGFFLETMCGREVSVIVDGDFEPGHDAARDQYGNPTEASEGDKWEILWMSVGGEIAPELTVGFCGQFAWYDRFLGGERPMTVAEFKKRCEEELSREVEDPTFGSDDDLPF